MCGSPKSWYVGDYNASESEDLGDIDTLNHLFRASNTYRYRAPAVRHAVR